LKRLDQLSFKQLRALQLVAKHGTITAAAEVLGVTGPAVHNQLKTLEDIIGAPLLVREGRYRNSLTAQGRAMQRAERQMRATLERAIGTIEAPDKGREGAVVLGAVSTAKYFTPAIVARLDAELPGIKVVLKVANRSETIEGLQRGAFDLCIMGRPPREPLTEARPLADNPHLVIAPPDHPLTGQLSVGAEALRRERFILREQGSGTRLLTERYLDRTIGLEKARVMEMDSNETIKQAVMSGLGIALISAHTVASEIETGRLAVLRVQGMPILRKWYLLTPGEFEMSGVTRRVRDWMVAHAGGCLPDIALDAAGPAPPG